MLSRRRVLVPLLAILAGLIGTAIALAPAVAAEVGWSNTVTVRAHWTWPVRGSHRIVRPFIAPATPYSAGHRGIDIAASGDVYAPANGVVHYSGFLVNRYVLSVEHPGNVISSYEPVRSTLARGDPVTQGEVIGTIEPGHCTELCLHFGVRVDGQYVSPLLFLGGIQRPILLPTRSLAADAGAARRDLPAPANAGLVAGDEARRWHIVGDHCTRRYYRVPADGHTRQDHCARADPHVFLDRDRATGEVELAVRGVDRMTDGDERCPWADHDPVPQPDAGVIQERAVLVDEHATAEFEAESVVGEEGRVDRDVLR
jgi:hypothetical protein